VDQQCVNRRRRSTHQRRVKPNRDRFTEFLHLAVDDDDDTNTADALAE
jgi:hypothetical protein